MRVIPYRTLSKFLNAYARYGNVSNATYWEVLENEYGISYKVPLRWREFVIIDEAKYTIFLLKFGGIK